MKTGNEWHFGIKAHIGVDVDSGLVHSVAGGVNVYVMNSRVSWADSRERLPTAVFTVHVLARADEQET